MSSRAPPSLMQKVLDEPLPKFVALPRRFRCVVCHGVLKDPWQTECGHRMCVTCLDTTFETAAEVMCPALDEDCVMISKDKLFYDRGTYRELLLQPVYCVYTVAGCMVTMKWSQLQSHAEGCEFATVDCPFESFAKKKLDNHIKFCHDVPAHIDSERTSQTEAIQQLNAERDGLATKIELNEHRRCVQEMMTTHNNQLGNVEHRVTQLEQEEDRYYRGGSMSAGSLKELQATKQQAGVHDIRLEEMDARFQCLETANYEGVLIWKVTDYTRQKQDAFQNRILSLYSQPFYTDRCGYKMCGRIYLNGDGMGKGTHLSLFFCLMPGEYDALLEWPFRMKVTLSLLDQSQARRDLSDTFRPDPTSSSFRRPTTEMNIASGCPMFISHSDLQNSRFLKDDTIYMKIETTDHVSR
ncbi:TNF receptor-associated factor 3 [Lamellibrachia satsuma]|nr:TNF receptor-associated factor 3 [Lamellibrachia satsuma]